MIAAETRRLEALGHTVEVGPTALEFLIREGYHKTLGARPMRGVVERFLQEALAGAVLAGRPACGRLDVNPARSGLELAAT